MRLHRRLEENVGARIDEEIRARRVAYRRDPRSLVGDGVELVGPDDLVLEIATDCAGRHE